MAEKVFRLGFIFLMLFVMGLVVFIFLTFNDRDYCEWQRENQDVYIAACWENTNLSEAVFNDSTELERAVIIRDWSLAPQDYIAEIDNHAFCYQDRQRQSLLSERLVRDHTQANHWNMAVPGRHNTWEQLVAEFERGDDLQLNLPFPEGNDGYRVFEIDSQRQLWPCRGVYYTGESLPN